MNADEIAAGLAPTPGYRYADVVGDQLFVAGQVPLDASGALVGVGDARLQATSCLGNLETVLRVHGFATTDIRKLTVYVVGEHRVLGDTWQTVTDWFGGAAPPSTLLGVDDLGYAGQLVEIDAIVVRR